MGLKEILAARKLAREQSPILRQAEPVAKTPISLALHIYQAAPNTLYLNYFEEYKLLIEWLEPFDIKGLRGSFNHLLGSYELQEIAKFIDCTQYELYQTILSLDNTRTDG